MGLSRPTRVTDKSDDVYHDYLNIVVGYSFDATKIQWRLGSAATFAEYEIGNIIWSMASQDVVSSIAHLVVIWNMSLPTGE
jgi:hypothetical protein